MPFLSGLACLIGFQLLGELMVQSLGLPLPGQVLGMMLLFFALVMKFKLSEPSKAAAPILLLCLPVYFVPAGVGLMLYLDDIRSLFTPVMTAIVLGLLATLLSTAAIMAVMLRITAKWR